MSTSWRPGRFRSQLSYLGLRLKNLAKEIHWSRWRNSWQISSRRRWDQEARWYRLRYGDEEKVRDMVNRISRVSSRVGMRWRGSGDGAVQCWVGVEHPYADALERMASTFACSLSPVHGELPQPLQGAFGVCNAVAVEQGAVDAYVVNEHLFGLAQKCQELACIDEGALTEGAGEEVGGIFFPVRRHASETASTFRLAANGVPEKSLPGDANDDWSMPPPMLGTTTQPHLTLPAAPQMFRQPGREWLLGWDLARHSIGSHQVGVVGDEDSVLSWLYSLALARAQEGLPLVVFDGRGNLARRLVQHPHINRMVARGEAALLDVACPIQAGFNPLAWSASAAGVAARWQWWFKGMGMRDEKVGQLIATAVEANVQNIPQLYQWLNGLKKAHPDVVVTLQAYLERLDADKGVREWILRPARFVDPRSLSRRGLLIVNGRMTDGSRWARTQAMRGLLGLLVEAGAALLVCDFTIDKQDRRLLRRSPLVVSNTVMKTVVVTRSSPDVARQVQEFLPTDAVSVEHLVLLPDKVAVVKKGNHVALSTWKK